LRLVARYQIGKEFRQFRPAILIFGPPNNSPSYLDKMMYG